MDNSQIKQMGLCTGCNTPTHEIIRKYPQYHPLAGRVVEIGKPLENMRRITYILDDGKRADVTYCKDCASNLTPENIRKSWNKILTSFAEEMNTDHRKIIGLSPFKGHFNIGYPMGVLNG